VRGPGVRLLTTSNLPPSVGPSQWQVACHFPRGVHLGKDLTQNIQAAPLSHAAATTTVLTLLAVKVPCPLNLGLGTNQKPAQKPRVHT
jgi:hypothetical protein